MLTSTGGMDWISWALELISDNIVWDCCVIHRIAGRQFQSVPVAYGCEDQGPVYRKWDSRPWTAVELY